MKRSLVLSGRWPIDALCNVTRAAETAGLSRVWTTEGTGGDGLVSALAIGVATSSIEIGTGIAYTFPRLPLHAAGGVAQIQGALGGRFTFGLGAGTRGIRRRYGNEEDHPAPRFAEYVDLVRGALMSSDGYEFNGRFYQCSAPLLRFDGDAQQRQSTRIYGSGVNKIMLETAAAHCDGVALHPLAGVRPYFDEVTMPALERGSARSDWRRLELGVSLWYICSVHADRLVARHRAAQILAFYFTTPSYAAVLAGTGWEGVALVLQQKFRETSRPVDWAALADVVPDDMIDNICLAGTAAEVAEKLKTLEEELTVCGIEEIVLQPVFHAGVEVFVESCAGIIEAARSR